LAAEAPHGFVVGDVESVDLGARRLELACLRRLARRGDDAPAVLAVLPRQLEAEAAIGAADEHARHVQALLLRSLRHSIRRRSCQREGTGGGPGRCAGTFPVRREVASFRAVTGGNAVNRRLEALRDYPFQRLGELIAAVTPRANTAP